eukprot:SAG31_NODE_134_length_23213_cov_5.698624_3_plen_94_part_00
MTNLRAANISLERELLLHVGEPLKVFSGNEPSAAANGGQQSLDSRHTSKDTEKRLTALTKQTEKEMAALQARNAELQKKERLFALHQRGFADA